MRAAWLTGGAVLTALALIVSTTAFWHGFAEARPPVEWTTRAIPFQGDRLTVEGVEGDVSLHIQAGEAGEVVIERFVTWSQRKPTVSEDWNGRHLRLGASCPQEREVLADAPVCHVGFQVFVPPETDLVAGTTGGALAIERVLGDVRATSQSGPVTVRDVPGTLWVRSGTGEVRGEDLRAGRTDVEVGSGSVSLSYAKAPAEVRAVARASGDIDLRLPKGGYDVTAEAEEVRVRVDQLPGSPRKIVASTPDGTIDVAR